jgi:hypothetical protein
MEIGRGVQAVAIFFINKRLSERIGLRLFKSDNCLKQLYVVIFSLISFYTKLILDLKLKLKYVLIPINLPTLKT